MHFNILPTFSKWNGSIMYKQQVYVEQNPRFPDNFVCWYLYILDQTSRTKQQYVSILTIVQMRREKGIVCALLAWREGSLRGKQVFCQNWEKMRENKYFAIYNRKIFLGN